MRFKYYFQTCDRKNRTMIEYVRVSRYSTFYEVLTNAGYNVTEWELSDLKTWLEIDSERLPTGRIFQLIGVKPTNEQPEDEEYLL